MYFFDYSLDGKRFHELASMNCSLMSTEVAGGFTGVVLGMFAEGKEKSGYADFGYFYYNEKQGLSSDSLFKMNRNIFLDE